MATAGGLIDSARRELARVVTTTSADVVGRLATVSAYLMLSPEARAEALRRINAVLPTMSTSTQRCSCPSPDAFDWRPSPLSQGERQSAAGAGSRGVPKTIGLRKGRILGSAHR